MNCIPVSVIFLIVYFANNIPHITYYIDTPLCKFLILGAIVFNININIKYALYIITTYLFIYNITITRSVNENFKVMETFQQYEQMDSDAYNDTIEFN
jgi:hypothetical protein